ncbi:MAG: hypothetical protein ACRDE8_07845 [Ginsengibacter sp.]
MKRISAIISAAVIVFFSSCNSNGKETEATTTDTTATTAAADTSSPVMTPPAFTPFKIFMVRHQVKNFAKWEAGYMANDSLRQVYGISHFVIGRGLDDSNMVYVIDKMTDESKAKEFAKLPNLKEAMQKAGVVGVPTFSYSNVIRSDDSPIDQKDRIMVAHKVKDFDAWLKVYDAEGKETRAANGMVDRGLARDMDDSNMVYIVFAVTDMAKAKARSTSPELKKLMTEAGVIGQPKIYFYKLVD